jgi:hypothetical protein
MISAHKRQRHQAPLVPTPEPAGDSNLALIVSDDKTFAETWRSFLSKRQFRAECVTAPGAGSDSAKEIMSNRPDFVLIDAWLGESARPRLEQIESEAAWKYFAKEPSCDPDAVALVRACAQLRAPSTASDAVIVVFFPEPGLVVSQILRRLGADWIWPYRSVDDDQDNVTQWLPSLLQKIKGLRAAAQASDQGRAKGEK